MNSLSVRSILAQTFLELIPPLIGKTLLESSDFLDEYGLRTEAVLSISREGIQFQQSDFFIAIRKLLSGAELVEVSDIDDHTWELKNIINEEDFPRLTLTKGKQQLLLPDFAVLSPDRTIRLRFFDEAASKANIPGDVQNQWRSILSERALGDEEFELFQNEFRETPFNIAQSLYNESVNGNISISTLVPPSRKYFERLVGTYDGSASIHDYAASSGKKHFAQLSSWQPYNGFLLSLFLSSHPSLTDEINVDQLSNEDLIRAFDFLDKQGDKISQLGAIEVGLRILPSRPEIEPILIRLVEQIRDDNVDAQASRFNLLSSLFIFVDGEMSRSRLLSMEPPFYRRLAALSQAALIQRHLLNSGVDLDLFGNQAFSNSAGQFYMQSLADMRLEPRWNPDLAAASQIKENFLSRIMTSASKNTKNIKESNLNDLILGSEIREP